MSSLGDSSSVDEDGVPSPSPPSSVSSLGGGGVPSPSSGAVGVGGGFYSWLANQGKTHRTIKETVSYARRFASVLDTGDASIILDQIKPETRHHVLSALANLAKYTGRYEQFNQIRRNYNLKWSKPDSLQAMHRFFNPELSLESMLQRIKEMVDILPPFMGNIIRFACLVGLRASEVIESVRLLNAPQNSGAHYYNPERQALEHFRFPKLFLRQTKKCYLSYITKDLLSAIGILDCKDQGYIPTRNAITHACQRKGIKMDMYLCRKIFASWLRKEGIQPEAIDLLQGRVSQSILTRHYLVPQNTLRDDVLRALEKLSAHLLL